MSIDKLNADNINLKNYGEILTFAMTCAEFFDNLGDMQFINTLPLTQNEFSNLHYATRQRLVNLIKSHIDYFDNLESRITMGKVGKIEKLRQEAVDRLVAHHQKEIDIFKAELTSNITTPAPESEHPPVQSDAEPRVMVKKIKELTQKVKAQSLVIQTGRPDKQKMKHHIDSCRKLNGKCNDSAVGRLLGTDSETAKRWILDLGLEIYAYNPDFIIKRKK